MSTLPTVDPTAPQAAEAPAEMRTGSQGAPLAICLPSMPSEALQHLLSQIQKAFPDEGLLVASPDQVEDQPMENGISRMVPYPTQRTGSDWVLDAADYAVAARLATERTVTGVLLLGTEAASLDASSLRQLRQGLASGADLVLPRYVVGPQQGLVNSALLYPLTRALFGLDVRFPLPLDAALSTRMLARLSALATRSANQSDGGLAWPVAEAATAGWTVRQVEGVERALPRPQDTDLNTLFPSVTASLFTDLEARAAFWQRARPKAAPSSHARPAAQGGEVDGEELRMLVEGYRLAFANLREIWALVLPPQSLLALKKMSQQSPEGFSFPPSLWARVVYDFLLAFHLRTLNRGHLLGAMTPLYLAWVASLLRETEGATAGSLALESTASAFEQEKPYLVSRWRWPDRFNP